MEQKLDKIDIDSVNNLYQLFCARVHRSPNKLAYRYFDPSSQSWKEMTWSDMADHVARWQNALGNENLSPGDRVAIMVNNCPEWVMFEQAALGLGLVVVPLYTNDRADNVSYIIDDATVKLLFIQDEEQWSELKSGCLKQSSLEKIISKEAIPGDDTVVSIANWLPDHERRFPLAELDVHRSSLATIVYTSGTTGRPKGVMLSHHNILWNADAPGHNIAIYDNDVFLSFLPLSHTFERTVGHYLPILCGCVVAYARSIEHLAEDLINVHPTVLITVPRIFERVYNKISIQLQAKPAFARFLFESAVNVGWRRFQYS
jgi:long-chain acyl-CoA synthetase